MVRAAKANAALEGRGEVIEEDVLNTAGLIIRHRLKSGPFEEAVFKQDDLLRYLRGY